MITTVCVLIVISTCFKEWKIIRKIWWSPLYGIFNELLWILFILLNGVESYPLLIACLFYIYNYSHGIFSGEWKKPENSV